jgi:hypothetical protein
MMPSPFYFHVRWLAGVAAVCLFIGAEAARAHEPAAEMADAAQRFLASLDKDQKAKALLEFSSDYRQGWHFVPDRAIQPDGKRYGLPIGEMTQQQRLLAHALLSSGLSSHGYQTAVTIMSLEAILHDLENKNPIRNPELYYVTIFGSPSSKETWSWRFEGHHLSVNFTLVGGTLYSVTPSFFGSNPGMVKQGPLQGLRPLAAKEDHARALVQSLSEEQKSKAIIAKDAPQDIITAQERIADRKLFEPAKGIPFAELNSDQQAMLLKVVNEYLVKHREPVIASIDKRQKIADGKDMVFAWAGGMNVGEPHYYRIQTPVFIFEYDNTQNDANHVHAVWREFDGDFGADLLRLHHENAHKK